MDIVASQPATAAPPAGRTAVESRSPEVRFSKRAAMRRNNDDPPEGEKAARFEREVVPLREPLFRRALGMCHNRADAEDLVQDTMVKAYNNFHSFVPGSNLKAWLYRIQTNTYINGYRRKRRQPVVCSTEGLTDRQLAAHSQRTSTGPVSAEDEALATLPDTEVMAAMQSVPEQFRAVLYYADVEGFRYREIAEIMGTPTGTVMSRLARGRRHLRGLLSTAGTQGPAESFSSVRVSARHSSFR
jgi:RNA polymerase sigma-70 factor (ECF subfamily)